MLIPKIIQIIECNQNIFLPNELLFFNNLHAPEEIKTTPLKKIKLFVSYRFKKTPDH